MPGIQLQWPDTRIQDACAPPHTDAGPPNLTNLVRHIAKNLSEAVHDFRTAFGLEGPRGFRSDDHSGALSLEVILHLENRAQLHGESFVAFEEGAVPNRLVVRPRITLTCDPGVPEQALARVARHEMAHICFAVELADERWARESVAITEWLARVVEFWRFEPGAQPNPHSPPFDIGRQAEIWQTPPRSTAHLDATLREAASETDLARLLGQPATTWLTSQGFVAGDQPDAQVVAIVEWALGHALWQQMQTLEYPSTKAVLRALRSQYEWYRQIPGRRFLRSGVMGFESLARTQPVGREDEQLRPIAWLSMVAQATQVADALAFEPSRSVVAWLEPFAVGWLDRPILYITAPRPNSGSAPPPRRVFQETFARLQRLGESEFVQSINVDLNPADDNTEARVLWARLAAQLVTSSHVSGLGLGRPATSQTSAAGTISADLPLIIPADPRAHAAFASARDELAAAAANSPLADWLPDIAPPNNDWESVDPAIVADRPLLLVTTHPLSSARLDAARALASWAPVTWSVFVRPRAEDRVEELYVERPDEAPPRDPRYREDFCRFVDDATPTEKSISLVERVRNDTRTGRLGTPLAHLLAICRFGFFEVVLPR